MAGCDDQNFMHQKYLDEGETVYPGMADSVLYFAGNERVKFTWSLNADPRIEKCMFFWNDSEKNDSATVDVNRNTPGYISMESILHVKEGVYDFTLVTVDNEKHKSLAVTRTVQVYGPAYISRLVNRNMSSSFDDGELTISWMTVESALVQYTTVTYKDRSGVSQSIRIENTDTVTVIDDVNESSEFSISTSYLPEGGLDVLNASPVTYTVM
jgi:hypothetical protein